MPMPPRVSLLTAIAICAFPITAQAQVVELRATINSAQEVPANASTATGTAIMLYDVRANTFDLIVSINGMTNTVTGSHVHEAAAGANGGVVTNLGAEPVYTRSGNSLTGNFRNVSYGGDKLKLLQGGAYLNFHSAQYPGGGSPRAADRAAGPAGGQARRGAGGGGFPGAKLFQREQFRRRGHFL